MIKSLGYIKDYGACTDIGRHRSHNEDSLLVKAPMFIVADGLGGHEAGEVASEIAVKTFEPLASQNISAQDMADAVVQANKNIKEAVRCGEGKNGMGCTLSAVVVKNSKMLVAQVGDSRVYLLHNHKLQQITVDHTVVQELIDNGSITPQEAKTHKDRSMITKAVGTFSHIDPDLYDIGLARGDRILICSDGLTTMLSDEQIEEGLQTVADAQKCADVLVDCANSEGGFDNISVIVIDVSVQTRKDVKDKRKTKAVFAIIALAALLMCLFGVLAFKTYADNCAFLGINDGKVAIFSGTPEGTSGFGEPNLVETSNLDVEDLQGGAFSNLENGIKVANIDEARALLEDYEANVRQNTLTSDANDNKSSSRRSSTESKND